MLGFQPQAHCFLLKEVVERINKTIFEFVYSAIMTFNLSNLKILKFLSLVKQLIPKYIN